jgi:hypothetical protein
MHMSRDTRCNQLLKSVVAITTCVLCVLAGPVHPCDMILNVSHDELALLWYVYHHLRVRDGHERWIAKLFANIVHLQIKNCGQLHAHAIVRARLTRE